MEILIGFIIAIGLTIFINVKIADWGKRLGLRWGQILLLGIALSPILSFLTVFIFRLTGKTRA